MPHKLLLLADDWSFRELRRHGGLPEESLVDGELGESASQGMDKHAREGQIIRRNPYRLIPCRGGGAAPDELDEEGKDILFAELLGSTVCHLVVLENAPEVVEGLSGTEEVVLQGPSTLPSLLEWYRRFNAEAEERVLRRSTEFRHVLVLVCAEDLRAGEFDALARLIGQSEEEKNTFCDRCYVMLRKLELGQSDVLLARYVWPMGVRRLLVKLLEDSVTPGAYGPRAWAWRARELNPNLDESFVQGQFIHSMEEAFKTLTQATQVSLSEEGKDSFRPAKWEPEAISLPEKPFPTVGLWETYPVKEQAEAVSNPDRWQNELADAGAKFGTHLSRLVAQKNVPAADEAARVWSAVHSDPRNVFGGLTTPELRGPDMMGQSDQLNGFWREICGCDEEKSRLEESLSGCVQVMEEAQRGFVEVGFRLVFAFAATLLVAYVTISLLLSLQPDGWWIAAPISISLSLAAAIMAVLVPWGLERFRGDQAIKTYIGFLGHIDNKILDRHRLCQNSIAAASNFWQKLRANAASDRLRLLLRRVKSMLEKELQPEPPSVQLSGDESTTETESRRDHRRRQQRALFNKRMTLGCEMVFTERDLNKEDLRRKTKELIQDFLCATWPRFCEVDKANSGHLPAHRLVPLLRDFCEKFREAIAGEVNKQAIDAIRDQRNSGVDDWKQEITHLEEQYHYMSCPLSGEEVNPQSVHSVLLVRRDFLDKFSGIESTSDRRAVREAQCLSKLPIVGYFYTECPLQFSCSPDGFIKVKTLNE